MDARLLEMTTKARSDITEVGERCHEVYGHCGGDMTSAEFRSELGRIQGLFDWSLSRGRIRARLRNDATKRLFDPLTAVAFFRTGKFFLEDCRAEAAQLMGLNIQDCAEIIAASNYAWDPSCRQGQFRKDLLDLVMPELASTGTMMTGFSLESLSADPHKRIATPTH